MKKAIVTGATGFIGSSFVNFLSDQGVEVLALGRKRLEDLSELKRSKLKRAHFLRLDMAEILDLENKIGEIGWSAGEECVFINLAWGGKIGLSDMDAEAQLQNVVWSVNALEIANSLKCKKFVQIGTMEESFTKKYLELDHNNSNKYNRHVIYSVAKLAGKNALKLKANSLRIDLIYVLHSHVMGIGDDKDSFLQVTLQKLIQGRELIFSSGEQLFDVISLLDCCNGYYLACTKGKPYSEYWVGSGEPRPLKEYVQQMYSMFPSNYEMKFGQLPYNDISLNIQDFSIEQLVNDTGYKPTMSFKNIVSELHDSLVNSNEIY